MSTELAPSRLRRLPSWMLNQTAALAHRLVTEGLGAVGFHRYHYALMSTLEEFGPTSQADLGRRSGLDRSDVVAVLDVLAERKLIERTPDVSDRRRNTITLTSAGVRQLRQLDGELARAQDALLAALSSSEREHLARLLDRVLVSHAPSPEAASEPRQKGP
ncbi:MarR family transcriptional regulator [Corallococcus terminator]|uniref:MarR family transcriptional regulator n=2 Tax=Corallococcus terminator TaxID=2316733 RepID=A0A3A8JQ48_9BACT|nr:MarR family transcriptional regulator [Corallococcus terminator]